MTNSFHTDIIRDHHRSTWMFECVSFHSFNAPLLLFVIIRIVTVITIITIIQLAFIIRWVFVGASMPHRCLLPNERPFFNQTFQPVVQVTFTFLTSVFLFFPPRPFSGLSIKVLSSPHVIKRSLNRDNLVEMFETEK